MDNIEEFKQAHKEVLLSHSFEELALLSGKFGYEIEYSIMQMRNYLYDIKHVLEQKMDYSIVSHLTYNLNIQLLHSYNRANDYYEASRYYLIGNQGIDIQEKIEEFQKQSKEIKVLIDNLNQISLFEIYCAHSVDFLSAYHFKEGLEGKNGSLLKLERNLSFMNGVQLLKCLIYLMDLNEKILIDIRSGITYETSEFIELVYDLNYVFYSDNYWREKREQFRNHVENDELVGDISPTSLHDYYKDLLRDFKTNPVGHLWDENVGNKSELAYELKILPLSIDQWEYYFTTIFKLEEIKRWINDLKSTSKPLQTKKKSKLVEKQQKPRETMTFKKKNSVLDGHLTLLFNLLSQKGWISGNEANFKALFSGRNDEDCVITWLNKFGKSTLFVLFQTLCSEKLVIVPKGFALSSILEGHFQDKAGQWLSGLDKGNKPNDKAIPFITECIKLLKTAPQQLANGYYQEDDDFPSVYDQFDHQDMQLHTK